VKTTPNFEKAIELSTNVSKIAKKPLVENIRRFDEPGSRSELRHCKCG